MSKPSRAVLGATVVALCAVAALVAGVAHRNSRDRCTSDELSARKQGREDQARIDLQFDNTHYRRDNPKIASDLEQMPNLLNFLKNNGTLVANDHTILISHTAGGILSSLTGLYPDRTGQAVSNSYDYYKQTGCRSSRARSSTGRTPPTARTTRCRTWSATAARRHLLRGSRTRTRAATSAACRPRTSSSRTTRSTQVATSRTFTARARRREAAEPAAQRMADFVGIAIHCAKGNALCGRAEREARPGDDRSGLGRGLSGAPRRQVRQPCDQPRQRLRGGNRRHRHQGSDGTFCGFPGFDGALAKNTLGEVAQMQENGVPVTFAYISDAHDNHTLARASGPGEADYKQQLSDYNDAFGVFFNRLKADGIDKSNTLFVITVDEGDHFAGGTVTPDANGVATYTHATCPQPDLTTVAACPANQIGEVEREAEVAPAVHRADVRLPLRRRPDDLRQRAAGADERRRPPARTGHVEGDGSGSVQERCCPDRVTPRRLGRGERASHGDERSEANAVLHDVRRPRHLLHRAGVGVPGELRHCGRLREPGLRMEPRGRPGRDRQHLVRDGRARDRQQRRRHEDVDGSRRPAGDDEHAARPSRQLRRRRSSRDADRRQQGAAERASRRQRRAAARRRVQADQRAVRSVRNGHARRIHCGAGVDRRHSSTTRSKRRSRT